MPITPSSTGAPSGTEYTILHSIVKVLRKNSGELRKRKCNFMNVCICNSNKFIQIPCFNCSGFTFTDDYYGQQEERLTWALLNVEEIDIFHTCARSIAKDIVQSCVFEANKADIDGKACLDAITTTQLVGLGIKSGRENEEEDEDDVEMKKKVKIEALMEMVDAKEGDRRGREWLAKENLCSVCSEEIERPWFSLTVPSCGHVFHEKCLVRWCYRSNVCPLCRVELPTED